MGGGTWILMNAVSLEWNLRVVLGLVVLTLIVVFFVVLYPKRSWWSK